MIAALDTSNGISLSVADSVTGEKIFSTYLAGARGTLTLLPNFINKALAENNLSLQQIEKWVLGTGPGSFTGIRIGLAFAKGICLVEQKPFTGLTTSYALAAMALEAHPNTEHVGVLYDGRKNELLYHVFKNNNGEVIPADEATVICADDLQNLSPMPDSFISLHHDAVNKILPAELQEKTVYADSIDAFYLINPASNRFEKTLEKMIETCEPVYVRPAVFTSPKEVRVVK